ncbi:fluoride efflux transporter FluC [Auraticoccus monumenti]|uniref:Fluoride-specific ion channel FluC n=1 Tax=Auraticoccus monumenti TaxID=675864 RepID=A0A1G6RUG8_9ACTN|nr:CrcB family protein [Auraticoccus monumenti]SDD08034.1 camphor resistance protein CrcB [Auraticoccus monumenti]
MTATTWLAVALGGFLGGALRGWLATVLPPAGDGLPRAVLLCNVAGSFALGLATALLLPGSPAAALVGTGFCGALTTWSTFSLDVVSLLEQRRRRTALGYVLTTAGAGLLAAAVGLTLGSALGG